MSYIQLFALLSTWSVGLLNGLAAPDKNVNTINKVVTIGFSSIATFLHLIATNQPHLITNRRLIGYAIVAIVSSLLLLYAGLCVGKSARESGFTI